MRIQEAWKKKILVKIHRLLKQDTMYITTHAPEIQKHPEVANKEQDEVGTPLVYERCAPAAAISDENNSVGIQ